MKASSQLKPWTVKSSKHVLRDRWISIRADECVTQEGTIISPYYVLEYPSWVNIVAFDREDRILLIRQYRHGIGKISSEIPSGGIEPADESPSVAAERELLEETGYRAERLVLAGKLSPNPANQTNYSYCFVAEGVQKVCEPQHDPAERIEYRFVDLHTLMQLIDNGEFLQSIHVASVFLVLRKTGRFALS